MLKRSLMFTLLSHLLSLWDKDFRGFVGMFGHLLTNWNRLWFHIIYDGLLTGTHESFLFCGWCLVLFYFWASVLSEQLYILRRFLWLNSRLGSRSKSSFVTCLQFLLLELEIPVDLFFDSFLLLGLFFENLLSLHEFDLVYFLRLHRQRELPLCQLLLL